MTKWVKSGDFSRRFNSGGALTNQVGYKNTNANKKILSFEIFGYGLSNQIGIAIKFKTKSDLKKLVEFCPEKLKVIFNLDCHEIINAFSGTISLAKNSEDLQIFLLAMHRLDSFDEELKQEIATLLNIKIPKSSQEIIALLDEPTANLSELIKQAQESNDGSALWCLGQALENKPDKLQEAVDCYQLITAENPNFKRANQQIAEIIDRLLCAYDRAEVNLSVSEIEQYKLQKFDCLLKAAQDSAQQLVIDQLYHQLSGGNDLKPSITNVKVDSATLINLAEQTKSLREQNQALQAELKFLKSKQSSPYFFGKTYQALKLTLEDKATAKEFYNSERVQLINFRS